ncbi:hypothetical protein C8T65DRAFT_659986 [Cerioporus squamosus]|nr:hypothetical protein C8T65DRAFT_659986 [Cerioporus squamosus]
MLAPPPRPEAMSRSTSGGSVLEDVRDGDEAPRQEFLQITDLDVLASRALEGAADGRNYEDLLLVSEVLGSAPRAAPAHGEKQTVPFTGTVEVKRRRVLKDGRVKLKLSLLGVPVDRCGVCLSQFRKEECGALTPVCKHSFHEVCLRRWLRTARVCPICRMALSMDD